MYTRLMQYEIEIKSLLGSQAASKKLLQKAKMLFPDLRLTSEQRQLNHYFKGGTLESLIEVFNDALSAPQIEQLHTINKNAKSINVRSRQKNDVVLLIVKGSLDSVSAAHSHQRMEFEAELPLTIDELDEKILKSDWQIEAKWQADRKIYEAEGITIDIFFSPGYGYLAEFEKVVTNASDREAAHASVEDIMKKLDAKELPNDRLERMFAYYNQHWPEYYGTDKIFVIE